MQLFKDIIMKDPSYIILFTTVCVVFCILAYPFVVYLMNIRKKAFSFLKNYYHSRYATYKAFDEPLSVYVLFPQYQNKPRLDVRPLDFLMKPITSPHMDYIIKHRHKNKRVQLVGRMLNDNHNLSVQNTEQQFDVSMNFNILINVSMHDAFLVVMQQKELCLEDEIVAIKATASNFYMEEEEAFYVRSIDMFRRLPEVILLINKLLRRHKTMSRYVEDYSNYHEANRALSQLEYMVSLKKKLVVKEIRDTPLQENIKVPLL